MRLLQPMLIVFFYPVLLFCSDTDIPEPREPMFMSSSRSCESMDARLALREPDDVIAPILTKLNQDIDSQLIMHELQKEISTFNNTKNPNEPQLLKVIKKKIHHNITSFKNADKNKVHTLKQDIIKSKLSWDGKKHLTTFIESHY